jgi:hypothetical protein
MKLSDRWKGTKPLKRWALVMIAVVVMAFISYPVYVNHMRSRNRPAYPPSWSDIQSLVNANAQWEVYKKGGEYLQALQSGTWHYPRAHDPTCDARPINAIGARVTVDFLRTLTPAHVEMLKDKLPFSKLTQDQKKILYLEPGYHYNPGADLQNSYIKVVVRKFGKQDPYADFFWCTKTITGQEILIEDGGNNFYLKDVAKWQQPWN